MRSDVLRVFLYSIVETRHFEMCPNRFGYISDTYQCAPALCLEAVPEGYPLRGTPYDYHSHRNNYKQTNENPGILDFLSVELRKRKRKKISGILMYFVSVACRCGLCVPNMIIMKANAKEIIGEIICLSITKARAKQNHPIFICNRFRADGIPGGETSCVRNSPGRNCGDKFFSAGESPGEKLGEISGEILGAFSCFARCRKKKLLPKFPAFYDSLSYE